METKTVYQADERGFFLYEAVANELALSLGVFNIPYGATESAPPIFGEGMVAKWDGVKWIIVEDHRGDRLYVRGSGEYRIGAAVQVDGESVTYDGGGPLPSWLTLEPPEPVSVADNDLSAIPARPSDPT